MKTTLVLFLTAILFGSGVLYPSAALAITAEDIVSQLEQREQNMKNIRGKFNVWSQIRMNDGNMVEVEKQYEWVKKDNTQKLTSEYKSMPERFKQKEPYKGCPNCPNTMHLSMMVDKEISTFDGQVTKRFLPDSNKGLVFSGGKNFFAEKMPVDWLLLRVKEKTLSGFLKQEDTSFKYAGDVNLAGLTCHLLEITTPRTNEKLYLADEQGLVPIKLETNIVNHTLPFNTRGEHLFSEFKRYKNVSIPTKVIVSVYNVYPDREQLAMKEVFTVESLDINGQIPDADLLMQFPVGTRVNDTVSGKDYVVVDANLALIPEPNNP